MAKEVFLWKPEYIDPVDRLTRPIDEVTSRDVWPATAIGSEGVVHKLYVQLACRVHGTPNARVLSVGSDRDDKSPGCRLPSEPMAVAGQTSLDVTSSIGRCETIDGVDVLACSHVFLLFLANDVKVATFPDYTAHQPTEQTCKQ
ncbi:hypothetical protein NP493_2994g00000 [Ridgeia piscesae]|uniref:Uncharacterized protein n=1 Tax=Ridgeia piscesae TaxID=27915 RepID=A0AAD9MXT9_RIDPI|nr:hypothetical protein NP493_2994g00000 [Ridgeia piscesae]